MSIRNNDYGMSKAEYKSISDFCQSDGFELDDLLLAAAILTNKDIAKYLFESIRKGVSYEKLSCKHYIPLNKNDFYAYRRRCMAAFKAMLD